MTNYNISFKSSKISFAFLTFLIITGFSTYWNPPPGLTDAEAIGPFINNNLPNQEPQGNIVTTPIYTNFEWESPIVAITFPGTNNMLIIEMDGRFFTLSSNENTSNRTTVLDIQDRSWYYNFITNSNNSKHGGIQNAVFHPDFGTNQGRDYLYVYYIHNENNDASNSTGAHYNRLSRFTWTGNSFNPNSELIMINQYDTAKGHDGSGMFFGTDGFLYVSVGDEGTQNGGATAHTQRIDDRFRSGVWRIDVDQQGGNVSHPINRQINNTNTPAGATQSFTQGYFIPNDNPWVNPDGSTLEEFYAIGLRQPYRMTQDAQTGNIWIGDVGGGQREEVNLIDQPGLNFEWNYKEGTEPGFRPLPNPFIGTARPPLYEFPKTGSRAVIGGCIYRGNDIPQLAGRYIYGDNGTGDIFSITHVSGNANEGVDLITSTTLSGSVFSGISSFGINHDNEILVLQLGANVTGNGRIYRLEENTPNSNLVFPNQLSQIGIFTNLQNLTPAAGIIPYDVNNELWSAGTDKRRWVAIPNDGNVNSAAERIGYSQNNPWTFPIGTVFIKQFDNPNGTKLETRVWIHGVDGNWFGTTYRWNNTGTDAFLLLAGATEEITIDGATFDYVFPSVTQCQNCHIPASGDVLGFRTHQLNRDILYPTTGVVGNQLETFAQLGFIPNVNTNTVITSYPLSDNSQSLELRARSYLDSNCSHCHNPNSGNRSAFDTRYTTNFNNQNLLTDELIEGFNISGAQVIAPQSLERSILYQRLNTTDGCCAMPPLAKGRIDVEGVQLIANWIYSLDANCSNSSSMTLGNTLGGPTNFVDGHNPAINVNEGDAYTNTSGVLQEVCIVDFNFVAQRLGNPITPFIARVNSNNNFTVLTIGQTRTSNEYSVGNNSFPFTNHSDDVLILQPGERIAIGFMDAFPLSPDPKIQSVIPAQQGNGEDEVWQTFTATNTTNPALFPTLTVGEAPGLGTQGQANLSRSYRFNIGVDISEISSLPPSGNCNENLALGKTATQSSTFNNNNSKYGAANGIDGNLDGNHAVGALTHTLSENNAWWEIDLGDVYQLSSVRLWNRTDCCANRLSNFHVLVSDVPFNSQVLNTTINQNGVGNFHFPGTAGIETDINLNRSGRYLRVQLAGNNALQLAEVEIFGCDVSPLSGCTTVVPARIQAENFCSQSGIQTEPTYDAGGGENVGYVQAGDYMDYQIQVPSTGSYQVNYRIAANGASGGAIQLQLNGNNIGNISLPGTGGWQTYTTVSNEVSLTQGPHTLRVFAQQAGWNLNWFEFEALNNSSIDCNNPQNIALGKTAIQSSTWANNNNQFGAANAIDGNLDGDHNVGSLTHTLFDNNAWWEIDLGEIYNLSSVKLWNRTICCADRLSNFYVLVSDVPFNSTGLNTTINQSDVTEFHFPGTAGRETDINLNRSGRYLRVQLGGANALQLAEVEIFGCDLPLATIYEHCGYNGSNASPGIGEYPNMSSAGLVNNDVSSLRVPTGLQVTLFNNTNFGGSSITFTADDPCLINNSFNDLTGSLIIELIGAGERAIQSELYVTPVFGHKSKLKWYFLQEDNKKVKQYLLKHSSSEDEEMEEVAIVPAEEFEGVKSYEYLHDDPVYGINFYQVIVQYEDGTENYQMVGDIIFDLNLDPIQIAPNPATDYLNINLSNYMDESFTYTIQSISGVKIQNGKWDVDHEDTVQLDLSNIRNGIYIIYMKPENHKAVAVKFVIAKDY